MTASERIALTITPARLGFVLSLVSLFMVIFTAMSAFMESRYRISTLEASQAEIIETNKSLTMKIDNLGQSLNDFNLMLREIQVRQEAQKEKEQE